MEDSHNNSIFLSIIRCNNRSLPCRAGHFYGFVKKGETKCYEKDALKKEYLVISSQTAFSIQYLWDIVLQILHSNASFESLAKIYNDLHFSNLPEDVMLRRVESQSKRISEAFNTFAFLEYGSRKNIPPIITGSIDNTILKMKPEIKKF